MTLEFIIILLAIIIIGLIIDRSVIYFKTYYAIIIIKHNDNCIIELITTTKSEAKEYRDKLLKTHEEIAKNIDKFENNSNLPYPGTKIHTIEEFNEATNYKKIIIKRIIM